MDELPLPVRQVCASFTHALNHTAEGLLEGLYLRGSLCWGEFTPPSDIDFTAVLSHRPGTHDLQALEAAHAQIWCEFPEHSFEGHHVVVDDLRTDPAECPDVPCMRDGVFVPAGRVGLDPVAWAELDERGVRVAGRDPARLGIDHDPVRLWHHGEQEMATYWARTARELRLGWALAGRRDESVTWCVLGVARVHHLLSTGRLASRAGGGRHVLEHLDERWHLLAREALRIRQGGGDEGDGGQSLYASASQRGRDLRDFVGWAVADAASLRPPGGED